RATSITLTLVSSIQARPCSSSQRCEFATEVRDELLIFFSFPPFLGRRDALQGDYPQPPGNLLGRDQFPLSRPRAALARPLPGFRRGHVALPERPRPALLRPHRVNRTAAAAVVEDTVAVGPLAQAPVIPDQARIQA